MKTIEQLEEDIKVMGEEYEMLRNQLMDLAENIEYVEEELRNLKKGSE